MAILGILILLGFSAAGVALIIKGRRQGNTVDVYGTTGKAYIILGAIVIAFAVGFSAWIFVKNAEIEEMEEMIYGNSYDDDSSYGDSDYDDDDNSYQKPSSGSFTNKYGTRTTKCAISGCSNYIAPSGDTNCCISHSRTCGECYCYIDSDAMYCMDCISDAAKGNTKDYSASGHACYVCGDTAYSKYGSYYYCSDCMALVKAFS